MSVSRNGSTVNVKGVETVEFEGPHPAGNVGVQINHIKACQQVGSCLGSKPGRCDRYRSPVQ